MSKTTTSFQDFKLIKKGDINQLQNLLKNTKNTTKNSSIFGAYKIKIQDENDINNNNILNSKN